MSGSDSDVEILNHTFDDSAAASSNVLILNRSAKAKRRCRQARRLGPDLGSDQVPEPVDSEDEPPGLAESSDPSSDLFSVDSDDDEAPPKLVERSAPVYECCTRNKDHARLVKRERREWQEVLKRAVAIEEKKEESMPDSQSVCLALDGMNLLEYGLPQFRGKGKADRDGNKVRAKMPIEIVCVEELELELD